MKKYLNLLLVILTLIVVFCSSFLYFTKINNYSQGTIINYNAMNFIITNESKIYVNQKKEITFNKHKILIKIISKDFQNNNLVFYGIDYEKILDNVNHCEIKMAKESLLVFIYHQIGKIN